MILLQEIRFVERREVRRDLEAVVKVVPGRRRVVRHSGQQSLHHFLPRHFPDGRK
jgi:hypothetical protein